MKLSFPGLVASLLIAAVSVGLGYWFSPQISAWLDRPGGAAVLEPSDPGSSPQGEPDACCPEEEAGSDLDLSLEKIRGRECEHGTATYRCAGCRHEVGVVRLDPSLQAEFPGGSGGLVVTSTVSTRSVSRTLDLIGEVKLDENRTAHLSPRIAGIIRRVSVDIGSEVEAESPLFEIESVELGQAVSSWEKSRMLVKLSGKNQEREKSLFERKIASEQDVIQAEMDYERHRAELTAAEHTLRVLGLEPSEIGREEEGVRPSVGRLEVRAPFAGVIVEKHAVTGELAQPGKDVLLLSDLGTIWAWGRLYGRDLAPVVERRREGPIPVEVTVDELPGTSFEGSLDYVGATMDEKTRTVRVRATVANPDRLLRPGMFCRLRLALGTLDGLLAIPSSAILQDDGAKFVFKHLEGDLFVRRPVETGRQLGDLVEVLAGLGAGERIVTGGAFVLKSDVLRAKMGAGCAD